MKELYCDLVSLNNKVQTIHIQTVNQNDCETLHPLLGEHYKVLSKMIDRLGEDIIVKGLKTTIPNIKDCIEMAGINSDIIYGDEESYIKQLYKDYNYIKYDLQKSSEKETNLLFQNILIELWDISTKIYADMSREMENDSNTAEGKDKQDMEGKETKKDKENMKDMRKDMKRPIMKSIKY